MNNHLIHHAGCLPFSGIGLGNLVGHCACWIRGSNPWYPIGFLIKNNGQMDRHFTLKPLMDLLCTSLKTKVTVSQISSVSLLQK